MPDGIPEQHRPGYISTAWIYRATGIALIGAFISLVGIPWFINVNQAVSVTNDPDIKKALRDLPAFMSQTRGFTASTQEALTELPAFMRETRKFMDSGSRYTSEVAKSDHLEARVKTLETLLEQSRHTDTRIDQVRALIDNASRELRAKIDGMKDQLKDVQVRIEHAPGPPGS